MPRWFALNYQDILPTSASTKVFASYQFVKRIGEGGYGVVYSAKNVETRQWRAVKIMEKPKDFISPEDREQDPIEREAEILRSVDHINIVRLVDIFDEGTEMHIVMELMVEGSLHDLIVREKHLGHYDSKVVTQQICHALAVSAP
uniref:Protein kinase domain-containing protein n=1 Tax=Ganoderma boninense TaxID=34458 RepID=A0A5K1JW64_9APHY|nr:Protein kinase domain-containing protein [Ganoderma boninense]